MKQIIVKNRQTLWDIALQYCGSAQAALSIARSNNIALTDTPTPGTELTVPDVINKKVVEYYSLNGIVPATN